MANLKNERYKCYGQGLELEAMHKKWISGTEHTDLKTNATISNRQERALLQ